MPLVDRLRTSFKARVGHKRRGLNESNIFENGEPSAGGVEKGTPASFEHSRLFEASTSEHLSPYPYEPADDINDDVDDDGDSEESCSTDLSSENSTVRFISNSKAPGCSTALSPRLRSRGCHVQQENTLKDQSVSDSQQINDHIRLNSDSHTSAEDSEIFGSPLKRVKANIPYPSSSSIMRDQIGPQMGEDVEQPTPSSRPSNQHSEDNSAANNSTRMDTLQPILTSKEIQMPRRQQKSECMMVPEPRYLSSENPHRHVGLYDGVLFNHASANLIFRDNVRDSAISTGELRE
ncbi:hypothetical protein EAE96_007152 [Botrytis aclada]|nr:hypothetical protein EAE96_007152 [Botrytis aclada]